MSRYLPAGSKIYKGRIVPEKATIKTTKDNRECYLMGIDSETNKASFRYIDTGEIKEVNYESVKNMI